MQEKSKLTNFLTVLKVVKHWFRNTLFKERQRNKDSPYNFNNPPSTTLNLEEYERTGQAKVTPLNEDLHMTSVGFSTIIYIYIYVIIESILKSYANVLQLVLLSKI